MTSPTLSFPSIFLDQFKIQSPLPSFSGHPAAYLRPWLLLSTIWPSTP